MKRDMPGHPVARAWSAPIRVFAFVLASLFLLTAAAQSDPEESATEDIISDSAETVRNVLLLDVEGPIGPATRDFVAESLSDAQPSSTEMIVIRLDTPGGLDASTRDIVKAILNSPVPVATWVAPEGARAASAGTYILYASHVAAMSPATSVGAATPVNMMGSNPAVNPGAEDDPAESGDSGQEGAGEETDAADDTAAGDPADAMTRKVVNDSVAFIRGLADKRGRNADWAELAVREAVSITSDEALDLGVIDLIAGNVTDLLQQSDGRTVNLLGRDYRLNTAGLPVERIEPDWKTRLLGVITSPTIAYILLLIGVYGLILEGYNPGAVVPGVVGAICLLLALYAFQMLPVNYAGFGLIVLGIILMIAEAMAPSFGALGIGGVIAMVIGSIILLDTDVPGYVVSRPLIGAIAVASSLGLMAIIWFAIRARQRPVVAGREEMVGAFGTALSSFSDSGHVHVHGERWLAETEVALYEGQEVEVTGIEGLTLRVKPANEQSRDEAVTKE